MEKQMSMFEMLDDFNTPEIPWQEQKAGVKGWIIQITGIMLKKYGFKEDMIGVATIPVTFVEDTKEEQYNKFQKRLCQWARYSTGGWCGEYKKVYAKRPTWRECQEYVHKKYTIPEKVVYCRETANGHQICDYEEDKRKH